MNSFNRFIRFIILSGLLSCFMLTATGCGSESDDWDPDRIVYAPEYKELDLGLSNGHIVDTQELGGSLYFLTVSYDAQDPFSQNILLYRTDITGGDIASSDIADSDIADSDNEEIPLRFPDENKEVQSMAVNRDGGFTLFGSTYNEENISYFLTDVTLDGQVSASKDITEVFLSEGERYIRDMVGDGLGNLYFSASNDAGGESLIGIDAEGQLKGILDTSDYIEDVFSSSDGSVYVSVWSGDGNKIRKADFDTRAFGSDIVLTGISSMNNLNFVSGGSTGILVNDGVGIYECTIETGSCIKLLDWIDSDIVASDVSQFGVSGDKDFWIFSRRYNQFSSDVSLETITELAVLKQTVAGELPRKEIITYGGRYISSDISTAVVNFNKSNDKYRIQIKDYASDDYEAMMIQYNNDLTGPDCPDIIDLNQANLDQLISQGILADIYPYMDADESFHREDYLENILTAYEKDGRLYGIMTQYGINALVGSAEKLQGIERWNLDEMLEFAAQYPDSRLLRGTADTILSLMVTSTPGMFINWETGECYFQGEDFIRILEYAKTYGTEYDHEIGTRGGISSGAFLMTNEHINEIDFLQVLEGMHEGKVKFIGFPVPEGSGIRISPINSMGMSERSDHKEGVWEFFAYLYAEEPTAGGTGFSRYSLPITKSKLEEICQEAVNPDGNIGSSSWGYDDFSVDITASTQEQVTQFKELIQSAQSLPSYDDELNNIIYEETASYFEGQKTAQEVADVIQSRVEIYVSENS